jgi:hypothetical protein
MVQFLMLDVVFYAEHEFSNRIAKFDLVKEILTKEFFWNPFLPEIFPLFRIEPNLNTLYMEMKLTNFSIFSLLNQQNRSRSNHLALNLNFSKWQ